MSLSDRKVDYDIIVAGAGMVGACAALSFSRKGFRVAVIESTAVVHNIEPTDGAYDLRVSAISPTSRQILNELGVWSGINHQRICDYEKMLIWHDNGDAIVDFDCAQLASQNLGAIVENRQVLAALHSACQAQASIDWLMPEKITALIENHVLGLVVTLGSGVNLSADLLIAADGRESNTRTLAGIEVMSGSYDQAAIVANVATELSHQFTARQKFLSTGPLAFLPLANGESSIVWSCDTALAHDVSALETDEFCVALSDAFDHRLGQVTATSERQSFPLGWHSCQQWVSHRVVLIGDAAHGVHPLAGQGVNLGFSDVALLTALVGDSHHLWNKNKLRQFERQRKSETFVATQLFSGLKHLYGLDNPILSRMRNIGMQAIQNSHAIKRLLMRQAMRNMG